MFYVRLVIVRGLIVLPLRPFMIQTVMPLCTVSLLSALPTLLVQYSLLKGLFYSAITISFSMLISTVCMYFIGFDKNCEKGQEHDDVAKSQTTRSASNMRVLLLGGTGPMGLHLSKLLFDDGVDTFVTSRRERPAQGRVRYLKGNARELPFLNSLLEKHWDAIIDFMVYCTSEMGDRVHALLSATDQYVYISSARCICYCAQQ